MVNLEVMFLTRTECSLNNSKAKSSRIVCCLIVVVQQYLSILELITRTIKIMAVKIQKSTIILWTAFLQVGQLLVVTEDSHL